MSALADRTGPEPGRRGGLRISYAALKRGVLWLLTACSGLALIEPSPYELVFLLAVLVFALTGIRFSQKLLPMALRYPRWTNYYVRAISCRYIRH